MRNPLLLFLICLLIACNSSPTPSKPPATSWEQQDSLLRFSAGIRLSKGEALAEAFLAREREKLLAQYEQSPFDPLATSVYHSLPDIQQSRLYHALKQMPKGGALHLHDTALGSAEALYGLALNTENCYIFWDTPSNGHVKGEIRFFTKGTAPAGFESFRKLASEVTDFKAQFVDLFTLGIEDVGDARNIWKEFEPQFQRRLGLIFYRPVFEQYLRISLDSLIQDGIQHVELRSIISDALYDLEHPAGYFSRDSMVTLHDKVYKDIQTRHPEFTLKLIYTGLRFLDNKIISTDLAEAIRLRSKWPTFIIGYDLVAEEDAGHPTAYHMPSFQKLDSLEKSYQTNLPLYLHDGESNLPENDNLYAALKLETSRIGHGFNLYRFPSLKEVVKARKTCLEVCPVSNQVLGYATNIRSHPAVGYLADGIPVALSSDDPCIFGYNGITLDFWAAYMSWELNLSDLKQLCINSIAYGSLTAEERESAIARWESEWLRWIDDLANRS